MYWDGHYLLALDGTTHFSSGRIHCDSCQTAVHKNGTVTYTHAAVTAVIVHPGRREVIPLDAEPIVRGDGDTKNDRERNASRRLLARIRRDHPHLKLIVVEDGLSSNGPHVEDLIGYGMRYIPGDHAYLFQQAEEALAAGRGHELETTDEKTGVKHGYLESMRQLYEMLIRGHGRVPPPPPDATEHKSTQASRVPGIAVRNQAP